MPPKATKENLTFIINVGTSTCCPDGIKILEKFKLISKYLIERKIFLQPSSEIGLILMGSETTKNVLDIDNIEEFVKVQRANWDVLDDIMALESTKYKTNWLNAVQVALKYIEYEHVDAAIKKLVLLSDFKEESEIIDDSQSDLVVDGIKSQGIQLIAIGEKNLQNETEANLVTNESILKQVCKEVGATTFSLDAALKEFRIYEKQPSKPTAWSCNLDIADIKIPIASYVKITDGSKLPTWRQVVGEGKDVKNIELINLTKVKREVEYYDRHRQICKPEDVTFAYLYGGEPVSFIEGIKKAVVNKRENRSYKVHSFTHKKNVDIKHWNTASSTRVVVSGNEHAAKAFYSLVQAMIEMNLVAIVRKVFNAGQTPRMVALFPCTDIPGEPWCLVEIDLPFAEDRRKIISKTHKSIMKQLSEEQNEAVDNFLDSLTLPTDDASEMTENYAGLYNPGHVPNPAVQHIWDMLSLRASNPEKPLQDMAPELKEIFECPPCVKEKIVPHLKRIKNLFELEIVENNFGKKRKKYVNVDENAAPERSDDKKDTVPDKSQPDDLSDTPVLSLDTSDVDLEDLAANI